MRKQRTCIILSSGHLLLTVKVFDGKKEVINYTALLQQWDSPSSIYSWTLHSEVYRSYHSDAVDACSHPVETTSPILLWKHTCNTNWVFKAFFFQVVRSAVYNSSFSKWLHNLYVKSLIPKYSRNRSYSIPWVPLTKSNLMFYKNAFQLDAYCPHVTVRTETSLGQRPPPPTCCEQKHRQVQRTLPCRNFVCGR